MTRFPSPRNEYYFLSFNQAWTVDYYLSLGAPAGKLIVGIPLYGRSYTLSAPQLSYGYGAPADAPGEEGAATREKGYLSYYEVSMWIQSCRNSLTLSYILIYTFILSMCLFSPDGVILLFGFLDLSASERRWLGGGCSLAGPHGPLLAQRKPMGGIWRWRDATQ